MVVKRNRICLNCERFKRNIKWCPVYAKTREAWMDAHKCRCFEDKRERYEWEEENG